MGDKHLSLQYCSRTPSPPRIVLLPGPRSSEGQAARSHVLYKESQSTGNLATWEHKDEGGGGLPPS